MQVWRTICTSVPLRASIRVSPDFTLLTHSSPSFGSDPYRSYSNLSQKIEVGRLCKTKKSKLLLSFRVQVCHPHTCDRSRLLGPCFKTGRIKPFRHRPGSEILQLIKDQKRAIRELRETFTHIMPQWKLNAQKHRSKHLNPGTINTGAKSRSPSDYLRAPNARWHLNQRNTTDVQIRFTALAEPKFSLVNNNLRQRNWFHSLPS